MLANPKIWISAVCSQNKMEPATEYFRESSCLHNARTSKGLAQAWKTNKRGIVSKETRDEILHDHKNDGIDRRRFLQCKACAVQVHSA